MPSGYEEQRERIVENFEQNKIELKTAVQDLGETMKSRVHEVRQKVNVRHQIHQHPVPWIAGGFALGLLLGTRKWLVFKLHRAGF